MTVNETGLLINILIRVIRAWSNVLTKIGTHFRNELPPVNNIIIAW